MSVALTIDVRDVDWDRLLVQLDEVEEVRAILDAEQDRLGTDYRYQVDELAALARLVAIQAQEAGLLEEVQDEQDEGD